MPWQNLAGIYCLLSRCLGRSGSAFSKRLSTCSVEFDGKVDTAVQELRVNRLSCPSQHFLVNCQYWKTTFALLAVQFCVFLYRVWLRPTNISSVKWLGLCALKGSVYHTDCQVIFWRELLIILMIALSSWLVSSNAQGMKSPQKLHCLHTFQYWT